MDNVDEQIRKARVALAGTGLIKLNEVLREMVPVDYSVKALFVCEAYNLLAQAHHVKEKNNAKCCDIA